MCFFGERTLSLRDVQAPSRSDQSKVPHAVDEPRKTASGAFLRARQPWGITTRGWLPITRQYDLQVIANNSTARMSNKCWNYIILLFLDRWTTPDNLRDKFAG